MTTIIYSEPKSPGASITGYRSLVRTVPPSVEPITLAEAKAHCRVDSTADDAYITTLITVAREYVEERLDVTLITSTWQAKYDCFPLWEILLPRPPMQNASVTVAYRQTDGNVTTIVSGSTTFQSDPNATPGRIYPLWAQAWPVPRGDENCVTVTWAAGYGASGASVPAVVRHAMLLLIGHWFASREPVTSGNAVVVPLTFETLIAASGWGGYR